MPDPEFSYAYGFGENHTPEDLAAAGQVIAKLYPDFYPLYAKRLQENHTYFGNMMIRSKPLFDEYCAFLFPILKPCIHCLPWIPMMITTRDSMVLSPSFSLWSGASIVTCASKNVKSVRSAKKKKPKRLPRNSLPILGKRTLPVPKPISYP